jgi:hypothetical protein
MIPFTGELNENQSRVIFTFFDSLKYLCDPRVPVRYRPVDGARTAGYGIRHLLARIVFL